MPSVESCRVRIFWPVGLSEWLEQQRATDYHLVGTTLHCSPAQSQSTVVAAVVGVINSDQPVEGALNTVQSDAAELDGSGVMPALKLTVLGTWVKDNSSIVLEQPEQEFWVAMHGSQTLTDAAIGPASSSSRQQFLAPRCSLHNSRLPQGTEATQVFLYHPSVHNRRIMDTQQQHAAQPPWLIRPPGAITLASVLQMLQEAHNSIQQHQALLPEMSEKQPNSSSHSSLHLQQHAGAMSTPLLAWPSRHMKPGIRPGLKGAAIKCWAPDSWRNHSYSSNTHSRQSAVSDPVQIRELSSGYGHECSGSSISSSSSTGMFPGLLQHALGLLAAVLLVMYRHEVLQVTVAAGHKLQHDVLQPHINWLREAHPGGIKLHFELSYLLASAADTTLRLSAVYYAATWPLMGPAVLLLLAAILAVGGAVTGLAAAAGLLSVVLFPVEVVYVGCAAMHRLQLTCLRATWRLLRGKQKVRRFRIHRQQQQQLQTTASPAATDQDAAAAAADEVSVEQLIVGVLLFTPLIGLMPTTTAWYLSICCCHGGVVILQLLLAELSAVLRLRRLQVLLRRWLNPEQFPGELMVQLLDVIQDERAAALSTAVPVQEQHVPADLPTTAASRAAQHTSIIMQQRARGNGGHTRLFSAVDAEGYYHVLFQPLCFLDVLKLSLRNPTGAAAAAAGQGWASTLLGWLNALLFGRS